jgi:hypothetical protein
VVSGGEEVGDERSESESSESMAFFWEVEKKRRGFGKGWESECG